MTFNDNLSFIYFFFILGNSGNSIDLVEVFIHDKNTQPTTPMKFRRDQTRMLVASLDIKNKEFLPGKASFYWKISEVFLPPFRTSVHNRTELIVNGALELNDTRTELIVNDTLELNISPKLLSTGLKLVTFELQGVNESSLTARDFTFIEVEKASLVVTIAGGTEIIRSKQRPISLDASSSYDSDSNSGTLQGMNLDWSCYAVSDVTIRGSNSIFQTPVAAVVETFFQLPNDDVVLKRIEGPKVSLDASKITNNQTYYVVLTVTKDNRTASAMQIVHVHNEDLLEIRIM